MVNNCDFVGVGFGRSSDQEERQQQMQPIHAGYTID